MLRANTSSRVGRQSAFQHTARVARRFAETPARFMRVSGTLNMGSMDFAPERLRAREMTSERSGDDLHFMFVATDFRAETLRPHAWSVWDNRRAGVSPNPMRKHSAMRAGGGSQFLYERPLRLRSK